MGGNSRRWEDVHEEVEKVIWVEEGEKVVDDDDEEEEEEKEEEKEGGITVGL